MFRTSVIIRQLFVNISNSYLNVNKIYSISCWSFMQKLPVVWTPDPSTGIGVGTVGGAPGERAPPKVFSLWHVQSCTVKTACAPPPHSQKVFPTPLTGWGRVYTILKVMQVRKFYRQLDKPYMTANPARKASLKDTARTVNWNCIWIFLLPIFAILCVRSDPKKKRYICVNKHSRQMVTANTEASQFTAISALHVWRFVISYRYKIWKVCIIYDDINRVVTGLHGEHEFDCDLVEVKCGGGAGTTGTYACKGKCNFLLCTC